MIKSLQQKAPDFLYTLALAILPVVAIFSVNVYGSFTVGIAVVLLALTKGGRGLAFDKVLALWIVALLTLAAASNLWAISSMGMKILKIDMVYIAGFVIYSGIALLSPLQSEKVMWRVAAMAALGMLLLTFELTFDLALLRTFKSPPAGEIFLPSVTNHGAVICALMFWPLFAWLQKRGERLAAMLAAAALAILLFKLGSSETAMGAFVISGVIYAMAKYLPRLTHWSLIVMIPVLIMLAPAIAMAVFNAFTGHDLGILGLRLEIWNGVAHYAMKNPLYGYGIEAARHIKNGFGFANLYYPRSYIMHPHNNFLQFWLEFGVIGAVFLSGFIVFVMMRLKRYAGDNYAPALACFAGVITVAATGYGFWQSWFAPLLFCIAAFVKLSFKAEKTTS